MHGRRIYGAFLLPAIRKYERGNSMKKRISAVVFGILFLLLSVCPVLAAALPRSETPDYKVAFYAFDCYHMQDENGLRSGYGYEMMQDIANYMQCTFSYVGYDKTAKECEEMLRNGEVDIYTAAKKTPEREDNDVPIFAMTANTFATDRKRERGRGHERVYSETGELKRDSDDTGREGADGVRWITGQVNNRKIWRRGSTALDCSEAFLWCIIGSKRKQGRMTGWKLRKISNGRRNWKDWMCFFYRDSLNFCFRVSGAGEEKRRSGLSI